MTDLETRLRNLRVESTPADEETVAADVRRAHRALGRRRAVRYGTGGVTLLAVAALATVTVVGQGGHDASRPRADAPASPSATAGTRGAGLRLVDYTGDQQPGFTVTKVPAGFVLQGATPSSLDVARADDHSDLNSFQDKLVVMLQSKDASFRRTGRPVQVHGATGYLHTEPGAATTLEYLDGPHDVVVQAWTSLGLTDAQIVEFAEGVTVTSAATAGVG